MDELAEVESGNTHRVAGEGNSGNENADAAPRQAGLTYSIAPGERARGCYSRLKLVAAAASITHGLPREFVTMMCTFYCVLKWVGGQARQSDRVVTGQPHSVTKATWLLPPQR